MEVEFLSGGGGNRVVEQGVGAALFSRRLGAELLGKGSRELERAANLLSRGEREQGC